MPHDLSPADLDRIRTWTPIDEDLVGVADDVARLCREVRLATGAADLARSHHWADVEGVDAHLDLPYLDDDSVFHRLDLFLPHDAVLRGGTTLPVYVDIHGGGFTYGSKELNRSFCQHLAAKGFAVFSVNYRLLPTVTFLEQLEDVAAAFRWIAGHLADYPVSREAVFVTGDSAGGALGFYATALACNPEAARAAGIPDWGLLPRGAALVSGLYDLAPLLDGSADGPATFLTALAPVFWDERFRSLEPRFRDYAAMVAELDLPPIYLCTSSDDFLEADSLLLGAALARAGKRFEIQDWAPAPGVTLGHVFPVCVSWLEESDAVLNRIREFSYRLL
ncbi:MAG: alpha/beta hydrolase [Salana multivorans]|nr:alpha/beta hydrolase [Salana multivorans]OJX94207.1 MAG: hypothetical protein BGO96_14790 [Micrococcales bacterium 73-15]